MASINNCLEELTNLTKQNLNILKTLNSALTSDKMHLSVKVDDQLLAVPSFLSLENKINNLQENFNNLVNAPKTGEAYFNFDGNSQAIELRGFTHMPNSIELKTPALFDHENNDIFKDFLTPIPYVNFELNEFPDDIVKANVRKIIPKQGTGLYSFFESRLESSSQLSWGDLIDVLELYTEDVHYTCYDKVYDLPVRNNVGTGEYIINEILDDVIDENLEEHLTIKFLTKEDADEKYVFTYKDFNYADKQLKVGDYLVTYNDKAKLLVEEIYSNDRVMKLKVVNGEYLNLVGTNDVNYSGDYSKLKYFSSPIINKTIKVPLEEDKLIYVAIAPLNSRMNIQSYWGTGVIINTSQLSDADGNSFTNYYKDNVKNIGDKLYELVMASGPESTKLTSDLLNNLKENKPSLKWVITQINKHLNDTATVKNIRSLYSQKKSLSNQLDEVVNNISNIETLISKASFDSEYDSIAIYNTQLTEYNKTKTELNKSINKIVNEIASAANNAEIPIENAKYHIRGYCEISEDYNNVIRGIKYRYRYKNLDNTYSQAVAVDDNFLFSDWVEVVNYRDKELKDDKYTFKDDNSQVNEPSFNQVDIPISQGETVDVQVAYIYDYGYPYFEVSSDWSSVENISFPQEYLKDVQILDIITENNSDIELNRFESIINETGITEHIGDSLKDQDVTFYHKPENISSGYYTEERRVIPLKDKLTELTNLLTQLQDEVYGTNANSLQVSVSIGDQNTILKSFQNNMVYVEPYNNFEFPVPTGSDNNPSTTSVSSGIYTIESSGKISVPININLTNNTSHALKLFSLFPGSRDTILNDLLYVNTKYSNGDYTSASSSSNIIDEMNNYYGVLHEDLKNEVGDFKRSILRQFNEYAKSNIADHEELQTMILDIGGSGYELGFKLKIGEPALIYNGSIRSLINDSNNSSNNDNTHNTSAPSFNLGSIYSLGNSDGKLFIKNNDNLAFQKEEENDYGVIDNINLSKYFDFDNTEISISDTITLLYFLDPFNIRDTNFGYESSDVVGSITCDHNKDSNSVIMYDNNYYATRNRYAMGNEEDINISKYIYKGWDLAIKGADLNAFQPGYTFIPEDKSISSISRILDNSQQTVYKVNNSSEILLNIGDTYKILYSDGSDKTFTALLSNLHAEEGLYNFINDDSTFSTSVVLAIEVYIPKPDEQTGERTDELLPLFPYDDTGNDCKKVNLYCIYQNKNNNSDNFYVHSYFPLLTAELNANTGKHVLTTSSFTAVTANNITNSYCIPCSEKKIRTILHGNSSNRKYKVVKTGNETEIQIISDHEKSLLRMGIQVPKNPTNDVSDKNGFINLVYIDFNNTWGVTEQDNETQSKSLKNKSINLLSTDESVTESDDNISETNPSTDGGVNEYNSIQNTTLDLDINQYLTNKDEGNLSNEYKEGKIMYSQVGTIIDNNYYDKYNKDLIIRDTKQGIWYKYSNIDKYTYKDSSGENFETKTEYNDHLGLQTLNQFIYFRRINPYTGVSNYDLIVDTYDYENNQYNILSNSNGSDIFKTSNKLAATAYFTELPSSGGVLGAALYPLTSDKYGLCISSDSDNYQLINPGQTITIPTVFEYRLSNNDNEEPNSIDSIAKTLSFDLRPSLYSDPINYEFTVIAKRESTQQDIVQQQSVKVKNKYNPTIIG